VFTARYALSTYIKQIRFVFKGLINDSKYSAFAVCFQQIGSASEFRTYEDLPKFWLILHSIHRPIYPEFGNNNVCRNAMKLRGMRTGAGKRKCLQHTKAEKEEQVILKHKETQRLRENLKNC
jgi:hypothetical protein